jgi:glycosyltransferase involved in cell wall biosynthesis
LDDEYQIVLIGLTEKQIKVLPNKIIGIRRTDSVKKLVAWYSLADVVLSLSYGESMGLTPVEGMACGTPAIVYDNTAQPELVTEDTGFVVKQGDVFAVKKAIDIIVKSKDQEKMKEACIKRANCFFDKNERYDDYLRLYEQLLPVKEENTIS